MTGNAEGSRILIMDDQADNVYLLERLLHRKGFVNLRGLTDPRAFLNTVAAFDPDLILLDLQMPYLDGLTLLERLREARGPGALPPVLVLTADITPEARDRALTLGARDFLYKPFDVAEAAARIRRLLEASWRHAQEQLSGMEKSAHAEEGIGHGTGTAHQSDEPDSRV